MIRYFLPTNNIDKIDLCVAGIEVHFHYLAPHIDQKHFNAWKSILYVEKSAVGQVITLNKSVINR